VTRENLAELFGGVDVLIEAVDTAEGKETIVEGATELLPDTPLVWAMGLAGCASANLIGTQRVGENVWVVGDLEADVRNGLPLLASRVMVASAHEAHMAIRILLGMAEE
jgi:sulfur carrier protein ThiS adenylyltransferase